MGELSALPQLKLSLLQDYLARLEPSEYGSELSTPSELLNYLQQPQTALESSSPPPLWADRLCESAASASSPTLAVELLRAALRLSPSHARARQRLIFIWGEHEGFLPVAEELAALGRLTSQNKASEALLRDAAGIYWQRLGLADQADELYRWASQRPGRASATLREDWARLQSALGEQAKVEKIAEEVAPMDILDALRQGQLAQAEERLQGAAKQGAAASSALWMRVGTAALHEQQNARARRCFERAHASSDAVEAEIEALHAWAEACFAEGDDRAGAEALIGAQAARGATAADPQPMAQIGQALLRAGQVDLARDWLERARWADAQHMGAALTLAELYADQGDSASLEELSQSLVGVSERNAKLAWLNALGRAWTRLGAYEQAHTALEQALQAHDRPLLPAEALVLLGIEAEHARWLQAGLKLLVARARLALDRSRAFSAAAILHAEGWATSEERALYETLRFDLKTEAMGPLPRALLQQLLGAEATPTQGPLPQNTKAHVSEVLSAAYLLFGLPASAQAEAAELEEIRPYLGLSRRRFRFHAGRWAARLVVPALTRGFRQGAGKGDQSAAQALDRAGLLLAGDPAVALNEAGVDATRRKALVRFAVSTSFAQTQRAAGLGLSSPGNEAGR